MKTKKWIAICCAFTMMIVSATACGSTNTNTDNVGNSDDSSNKLESVTVGIGQFAEHASLDNCRKGFMDGMKEEGYIEGQNVTYEFDNAAADTGNAGLIANNFVSQKVNLICAIATPMAQSAFTAAADTKIPVIYTAITDPIAAGLAKEDKTPTGEITGTSDKLSVDKQLDMIRKILPNAKKIGIMYSTSEVNSESAIAEYKELAGKYGFEIVDSGITTVADIPLATDNLLTQVDCINNLTDNTVVSALPTILAKANEKKIPVFGSEIEQVKKGCLATVGLDYYQLGIQTGKMAAKVLKGESKASEMKFEVIQDGELYINSKAAENLGLTLASDIINSAAEVIAEITE